MGHYEDVRVSRTTGSVTWRKENTRAKALRKVTGKGGRQREKLNCEEINTERR